MARFLDAPARLPGLTATIAVTICLPMTFAMSDSRAIALLMALYIGGISGGLVSSILLNIPGTPASMVTAFVVLGIAWFWD